LVALPLIRSWSVETKPQVDFEELRALVKRMQLQIHQCAAELDNNSSSSNSNANGDSESRNGPETERATSSFVQHVLAGTDVRIVALKQSKCSQQYLRPQLAEAHNQAHPPERARARETMRPAAATTSARTFSRLCGML
jgi:hypothetical protein